MRRANRAECANAYCPAGHGVQEAEPGGLDLPAGQLVVQGAPRPAVVLYFPAAHALHCPLPAPLYCPGWHRSAVALEVPAGHA